jgi:hypothetical protein
MAAALIAILAVRAVASHSGHATWLRTSWVLVGVALGAGVMLHEVGRGLVSQLSRPRWSARFAGTWAGSSALLLTVLLASGSSHSFGAWISVLLAVCLGMVLAASVPGARRLLGAFTRLRGRIPVRVRVSAVPIPCALTLNASVRAPLLAGWSDRGPPPHLS